VADHSHPASQSLPVRHQVTSPRCIADIFEAPGGNKVALILPKRDEIHRDGGVSDIFQKSFSLAQIDRHPLRRIAKDNGEKAGIFNNWFDLKIDMTTRTRGRYTLCPLLMLRRTSLIWRNHDLEGGD
jgi:hypothetical protein